MLRVAEWTGVPVNVAWSLTAILLTLSIGSAARMFWLIHTKRSRKEIRARLGSLITWWCFYLLLVSIATLGVAAGVVVFAGLSLLGLREYRALAGKRISGTAPWWLAYAVVPMHYLLVYLGWFDSYWTFIPVWVLVVLLVRLAIRGKTENFLEVAGIVFLGLMLIVFLLSHAVLVLRLPADLSPVANSVGLFIYLIVLTEINDIAQALVGRRFGRRQIAASVSPNKTWEGLLGGLATTVLTAVLLAPLLTPFRDNPSILMRIGFRIPYLTALTAGILIAVGGFLGDITMSAIKREVEVKDSGDLLPGQGGLLDRIDSLIFTAPLFFYFTFVLYE